MKMIVKANSSPSMQAYLDSHDSMFKVSEVSSKTDLTSDQALRIQKILKDNGQNVPLQEINTKGIINRLYSYIIDEFKKLEQLKTNPFKTVKDIKAFIKAKLGIGKTETKNLTILSDAAQTSSTGLIDAIKVIAPYVWYYIVLAVVFRVLAWVTGNRRSLFGRD